MKKLIILLLLISSYIFAQWKLNIKENTLLVTPSSEPFNIKFNLDASGGFYITWVENLSEIDNIYTLHYSKDLKPDFRTDGIPVSNSVLPKTNISTSTIANDLIVTWIENVDDTSKVYLQRLTPQGRLLLGDKGKVVFDNNNFKEAKSVVNSQKNIIVSAIDYDNKVYLSTFNSRGEILSDFQNIILSISNNTKSKLKIVPLNDGSIYVFWIEKSGLISHLYGQYVSKKGDISWTRKTWQKNPYLITTNEINIIDYEAFVTDNNELIVITESKENIGKISLKKFNNFGIPVLPTNLISISSKNVQNFKAIYVDNFIKISYLEENDDIYNLKTLNFDSSTNKITIFNDNVLNTKNDNLVYTITNDNAGGIYVVWLTKTKNNDDVIKAQRINDLGKIVYDQDGIILSNKPKSSKSYIIPFLMKEELTIIFKDSYNNQHYIFGDQLQRPDIHFEFVSFDVYSYDNKDVILEWSTIGEKNGKGFTIERSINNGNWSSVGFVSSFNKIDKADYNFQDKVSTNGIYKYRIFWTNYFAQKFYSEIKEIKIGTDNLNDFLLYQNEPNPASTQTIIKFYAPYRTKVKITIIKDLQPIQVIYDDFCEKGDNVLPPLDLTKYEDGVYIIQMRTNNFTEIKKMVVQK
ncbi:MAG TPA: hypothetical protein PLI27_05545 [Ignavibacteriales bacterium]|nr:hypothetical protein [Ignavibacteriales bacterium]HOM66030.1 hypothetical protein [Ignavibacteriales bacterium]HPD67522.1 hypothetical protein [Ignavibacteriales bacterium]HRR19278.1 hypothetical protein [Ignavibacteriales bacterium]